MNASGKLYFSSGSHFLSNDLVNHIQVTLKAGKIFENLTQNTMIIISCFRFPLFFFRAHLNDMENILPFLLIGFFYLFTNPALSTATLLFRIFTGARIVHSIVYLGVVPQPARALSFFAGLIVMTYMAVITLMSFK